MNLGEKIDSILKFLNESDGKYAIKELFTTSEDEHKTVHEYVFATPAALNILNNLKKDFEKYGECAGSDPEGHWIKIIDIKLM